MPPRPIAVLGLALLGISFAGPLVRLSAAHPLAIAAWRLGFSLALVGVALGVSGQWRQLRTLGGRDLAIASAAGLMLAMHFWSWNASIGLTTIAASVVLVNLQPVFVALLSVAWLRERPDRRQWLGIAVALAGALVVGVEGLGSPGEAGRNPLLGNLLAVGGAITAAIYYTTGRGLRQRVDLWAYVAVVYGACFVALIAIALALGAPLVPQPPRELAIFAALAVGPMMLGHTGMNYALRYLPAYVVNLTVLGEPVGATLLAAVIPGIAELPTMATVVGGMLILGGVLLAARRSRLSSNGVGVQPRKPRR
jgi:drug/metabolite transporter (DMT)-like permease